MSWKELIPLTLLGTDRARMPDDLREALADFGLSPDAPDADWLLEALAYVGLAHKMKLPLTQAKSEAGQHQAKEETIPPCSQAAALCLATFLREDKIQGVLEFLQLCQLAQKLAPPEHLPDLLDMALRRRVVWNALQPALGERGHWLIPQHPKWKQLTAIPDWSDWERGNKQRQKKYFLHHHPKDPLRTGQLLREWLPEMKAKDKGWWLEVVGKVLQPTDAAWLVDYLDDRAASVRAKAAKLLCRLPDTTFAQQCRNVATSCISLSGNNLSIREPEPAQLTFLQPKGWKPEKQSNWTALLMKYLSPSIWEKHLDTSPPAIIQALMDTPTPAPYLKALAESALTFEAEEWSIALLSHTVQLNGQLQWSEDLLKPLLAQLPAPVWQQQCEHGFEKTASLENKQQVLTQWLLLGRHPWSPRMSEQFLENMHRWVQHTRTAWKGWVYKKVLKKAVWRIPLQSAGTLQKRYDADQWPWFWQPEMEDFWEGLRKRAKLHRAFQPNEK